MTLLLESGCASEKRGRFFVCPAFCREGRTGRPPVPLSGKTPRDPSKFPSEPQSEDPLKKKFLE